MPKSSSTNLNTEQVYRLEGGCSPCWDWQSISVYNDSSDCHLCIMIFEVLRGKHNLISEFETGR